MAFYRVNAFTMVGRVKQRKPNVSPQAARQFINDRIREVVDARPYWSDLVRKGIWGFPGMYVTGTATANYGSNQIQGTGTAWPVNDVVNTTLNTAVVAPGWTEVSPASMAGINANSSLVVDAGGVQEVVPVSLVTPTTFIGLFSQVHATGVPITASSLAGQQLRMGYGYPVFTVTGVINNSLLQIDNAWGGPQLSATAYTILQMYVTCPPDYKGLLAVVDQQQGAPIDFHKSRQWADAVDPQRTSTGDPDYLIDLGPNASGNLQYEVWPAPSSARQLAFGYYAGWPELVNMSDLPPWFIDPMVFVNGAIADALRTKMDSRDAWFDPKLAQTYEEKYAKAVQNAVNADESKCVKAFQEMVDSLLLPRSDAYWMSHIPWDL